MASMKIQEYNVKTKKATTRTIEDKRPVPVPIDNSKSTVNFEEVKKLLDYAKRQEWI